MSCEKNDICDTNSVSMKVKENKPRSGERPYCYGKLKHVFPMGDKGFRESPESCFPCIYKTECLRHAMSQEEGLKARVQMVDRAYDAGLMGRLKRWSSRKTLHQKIQMAKKKEKK